MMAPLTPTLAHNEVRERCALAASYASAAAALAATGDTPAMAHSLGCAARVILAAVEAAETLRHSTGGSGR